MAPVQEADYQNGINGSGKCPVLNSNLNIPPAAPIPFKRSSRGKSPARMLVKQSSKHSLECPEDFVRPDLPSRCTWSPTADPTTSPHTKDQP